MLLSFSDSNPVTPTSYDFNTLRLYLSEIPAVTDPAWGGAIHIQQNVPALCYLPGLPAPVFPSEERPRLWEKLVRRF